MFRTEDIIDEITQWIDSKWHIVIHAEDVGGQWIITDIISITANRSIHIQSFANINL
jgi:hypothetical protein